MVIICGELSIIPYTLLTTDRNDSDKKSFSIGCMFHTPHQLRRKMRYWTTFLVAPLMRYAYFSLEKASYS